MRVDPKNLVRRLTPTATKMLEAAVARAASSQHAEVTIEHVLQQILAAEDGDAAAILRHVGEDRLALTARVERVLNHAHTGSSARPVFARSLFEWFEDAWLFASLELQDQRLRSGALLFQLAADPSRYSGETFPELERIPTDRLKPELDAVLRGSSEAEEATPSAATPGGSPAGKTAAGRPQDSALARFCKDFTAEARSGRIDPIFGRHREVRQMIDILARRRKNNPIIVGEPGVGKTALVEGLAHLIARGEVPESLKNTEVMGLDLGLLQAGASVKGEFENRLKGVISEVRASPKPIILFIDEAHTLIGAGGQQGGGDAANLLKPALARGELRTIAATTWAEYKKYFEKDAALERRFQPVKVDEPSEADAMVMLRGLRQIYEDSHGVRILDEAIVAAVELSQRYISGRQLPDKAVDLLDTAAARVRVERETKPEDLVEVEEAIRALERERSALVRDFEDGHTSVGESIERVTQALVIETGKRDELLKRWERDRAALELALTERAARSSDEGSQPTAPSQPRDEESLLHVDVDADSVARTVSAWTGIPLGRMQRDTVSTVLDLESRLRSRVIGQDHAVAAVAQALRIAHAGVRNPEAPVGVMLFAGPSGVGKTETAIALADQLYGGERFMTTINMTEFMEKHSVSRLIGSPPGYVGYGEGGVLTEAVRQRPYSVVLLDECEKADPEVMNLFYQVFDKGVLNDGEGRPINFRNTMIILTSNLATDLIMEAYSGDEAPSSEDLVAKIRPTLSAHFKPALLARMTVVPYRPIDSQAMRSIARLKLAKLSQRVEESHGFPIEFDDEVVEELAKRCTEAETGARNVDHILRGTLTPLIARELLGAMSTGEKLSGISVGIAPDGSFRVDVDAEPS